MEGKVATPRTLVESGAGRIYITVAQPLTNLQAHRTTLQTTTGATTKTTQAGNLKVRIGNGELLLAGISSVDVHRQTYLGYQY